LCQISQVILHEFSLLTFMMRIIYCSQHAINQFSLFIFQFFFFACLLPFILIKIHFAFFFIASSEEKKKCWKIYESSFIFPWYHFVLNTYTLHYLWDFFKRKFTRGMKWIEFRARQRVLEIMNLYDKNFINFLKWLTLTSDVHQKCSFEQTKGCTWGQDLYLFGNFLQFSRVLLRKKFQNPLKKFRKPTPQIVSSHALGFSFS